MDNQMPLWDDMNDERDNAVARAYWKGREDVYESDAYKALIAESTRLRAAATGHHATKAILLDLIEELRGYADSGVDSGWAPLYSVIDRAEQQLREVQDE